MPKLQLAVSRAMQHVESPKEGKWRGLGFGVWGLGFADIHSPKLTWKPIWPHFRGTVVFKGPLLGFHVSFQECTYPDFEG